ncbi:flippase-like domain-containing protein [Chloroflexi bacterium TSY]|nr:flippase-like domain-containing protein [Chloroflexi bacterium TSY]
MKTITRPWSWIRLFVGVGLFTFLFYTVDLSEVVAVTTKADLRLVILACGLGIVDRILMAYKWNVLLRVRGIWLSLTTIIEIYWASTFFGLFLPATIGGDAFRAYAVSKRGYVLGEIVSSIILERVFGLIALMSFVLSGIGLSLLLAEERIHGNMANLFWVSGLLLLVVVLFLVLSLNRTFVNASRKILFRLVPERCEKKTIRFSTAHLQRLPDRITQGKVGRRISQILRDTYESYVSFRHAKDALIFFLFLSLLENLFPIAWTYCLALAFQIELPFLYTFVLVPIVLLLRRLPISIDGAGIHEGAFVYLMALVGFSAAQGLLLGLVTHLLTLALVLPGGLFFILSDRMSLQSVQT